jgi:hypothetical protein
MMMNKGNSMQLTTAQPEPEATQATPPMSPKPLMKQISHFVSTR